MPPRPAPRRRPAPLPRIRALAAALALAGLLGAAAPARAALVGFYGFDNPGDFGHDTSGRGNDLLIFGAGVSYTAQGATGGGLSFSGGGGLTTPDRHAPDSFPTGAAPYALSVDFRTNVAGALGLIGWGVYGKTNAANALRTSKQGVVNYWNSNDLSGVASVHDDLWHTAIASFDGVTRTLYIDGSVVATDTPASLLANGDKNFAVGKTGKTQYFVGTLDNVAVFNTAATPAQVGEVLQGLRGLHAVPEPMTAGLLGSGLLLLAWRRRAAA